MPLLPPNQQRQSTEGTLKNNVNTENQINTSKTSDEVAPTTLKKF